MTLYHAIEQYSIQDDGTLCCAVMLVPVTVPPPQICELELQKLRCQIEQVRQLALDSHARSHRLAERNLSLHARVAGLEEAERCRRHSVLQHPALQLAVLLLAFLLILLAGG